MCVCSNHLLSDCTKANGTVEISNVNTVHLQASDDGATLLLNNCLSTTLWNTAGVKMWQDFIKATTSCMHVPLLLKIFKMFVHSYDLVFFCLVGSSWISKRKCGTRSVTILNARTSGPQVCCDCTSQATWPVCGVIIFYRVGIATSLKLLFLLLQVTHCHKRSLLATSWHWFVCFT